MLLAAGCARHNGADPSGAATPSPTGSAGTPAGRRAADTAPCPHGSGPRISGFPAVTLDCLTGPGSVDLAVVHGQPEVINIWASWCGPCREETARLQRAYEQAGGRVLFLGVDVKDSTSAAVAFLANQHVTYPQASDPDARFPRLLRLPGVPNTLVVDGTGHVIYRRIGELSEAQLRQALARVGVSVKE